MVRSVKAFFGAAVAAAGLVVGLGAAPAPALDGGTTCNTFSGSGFQSVFVEIGDGDTRTTFRMRNGRVIVDGTNCGQVTGRGTVDILDGGDASTNIIVIDTSSPWVVGGLTVPFRQNMRGHLQDGRPDQLIVNGTGRREVVDVNGSNLAVRRGGQLVFSTIVERTTMPTVNLRGGNDRFRYGNTLGNDPIASITVKGGAGADVMIGNSFVERFVGGGGNDRLVGKGGSDVLSGGPGDDRLIPGGGPDRVNGGPGTDQCRCNGADTVTNVP